MPRCTDHLGNEYPSLSAMARAYGLDPDVLKTRLRRGWDPETALTTASTSRRTGEREDHLGNRFRDLKCMATAYGIPPTTVKNRLSRGWDLEKALTAPSRVCNRTAYCDHLGNEYPTRRALTKAYGINETTLQNRLKRGMSLEDALTRPNLYSVTDHLGNTYPSKKEMLKAYGVPRNTFEARIAEGYSLEAALTAKPGTLRKPVRDYKGKEYPSIKAMLEAYKVPATTYNFRKRSGWTEKECLLGRKKKKSWPSKKQIIESEMRRKASRKRDSYLSHVKEIDPEAAVYPEERPET